nr:MAG TPA: hypothetical protein [Caudoviricetes sp.]
MYLVAFGQLYEISKRSLLDFFRLSYYLSEIIFL